MERTRRGRGVKGEGEGEGGGGLPSLKTWARRCKAPAYPQTRAREGDPLQDQVRTEGPKAQDP